jgi:hypothetical protein
MFFLNYIILRKFIPLAFILFWIVPVAWVGLMRSSYPLYPNWIAPLFRVSGVFESAPSRWRIFFIESQDKGGSWRPLDEKSVFASTPLGDRTRFQPLMNEIMDKSPNQASKLLAWINDHLPPSLSSRTAAIRIIHFTVPPRMFLGCASLSEVYKEAVADQMPRFVVVGLNITSKIHENH